MPYPNSPSREVPDGLDWQTLSAAYLPEQRRHDLDALTAYGACRRRTPSSERSARRRTVGMVSDRAAVSHELVTAAEHSRLVVERVRPAERRSRSWRRRQSERRRGARCPLRRLCDDSPTRSIRPSPGSGGAQRRLTTNPNWSRAFRTWGRAASQTPARRRACTSR